MVSPAGGIDIEEVAAKTPEKIFKTTRGRPLRAAAAPGDGAGASASTPTSRRPRQAADILQKLYRAFVDAGASLAEINPLVVTPKGEVVALDAKIVVDDNELERQARHRGPARRQRPRTPKRSHGPRRQPHLHQARRERRLLRERRRPRDGDDGPGEVLRRRARELPRHRRLVQPRQGRDGAQDHHRRPEREGDPVQHLRRHHPLRRRGQRHRGRDQAVQGGPCRS